MDIKELTEIQKEFDSLHGWTLVNDDSNELVLILRKDLIGLFGEVGEFANIIKKISLDADLQKDSVATKIIIDKYKQDLKFELIDSLIYLIRIATHLNIDIEKEYLRKLDFNREKYRPFEANSNKS